MTKRDFLMIMIRLFGLYLALQAITGTLFAELYRFVAGVGTEDRNYSVDVIMLLSIILLFFIFYFMVANPRGIINLFSMDRGYDDDRIEFGNLSKKDLLAVGLIILGGLFFVPYFTGFISQCYFFFETRLNEMNYVEFNRFSFQWWLTDGLTAIFGFLIFSRNKEISARLLRRDKD